MTTQEALEKLSEHNSMLAKSICDLTAIVNKLLIRIERLEREKFT
jgi:hypothetical protein